jgi:hypothetical protein
LSCSTSRGVRIVKCGCFCHCQVQMVLQEPHDGVWYCQYHKVRWALYGVPAKFLSGMENLDGTMHLIVSVSAQACMSGAKVLRRDL